MRATKILPLAIALGVIAAILGLVDPFALPPLVPQSVFALALIIVLLSVMNGSGEKRL